MGKNSNRTSYVAAAVVMIFNLLIMAACITIFAFSLWMIASPASLSVTIQSTGIPVVKALLAPEVLSLQLGIAAAVLSIFFFFVSFMGFYGAVARSQFMLFMYSTLILLLLLLECALIYYFSSNLVEKGLQVQDGQWTHLLRLAFGCCEYNASSPAVSLPWSCCGIEGYPDNCSFSQIYSQSCQPTITNWLHRYQTPMYASLAALHIILASCSLVRRTRSPSHSHS